MKLNLLPKHVAKSQGSRAAFIVMWIIIGAFAAVTFLLIKSGQQQLADARAPIEERRAIVARAMGNSAMADTIIAEMTNIDRNIKLTDAMLSHNSAHTDLYREVMGYIPSYYRITSISAAPGGPEACTVNMQGVLKTHKQYADLVLALYRMPGVTSVTRGGYSLVDPRVPALNESDQLGTAIKPGEANLPSDPEARMAALIQRAQQPTGFQNVNNFGTENSFKGAMPDWSTVTVTMTVSGKNITTPDPRGTLLQGGTGGAQGGQPAGRGATGGRPTPNTPNTPTGAGGPGVGP
jgi:hypothetical protein